jgi:hypothetical protein
MGRGHQGGERQDRMSADCASVLRKHATAKTTQAAAPKTTEAATAAIQLHGVKSFPDAWLVLGHRLGRKVTF